MELLCGQLFVIAHIPMSSRGIMNTTLSKLGKFKNRYQKFRGANKLITKSNVSMKELLLSNDERYIWNKYHVCYVKEMSSTQRKCLPSDKNVWYATEMSARHSSETRQVAAPPGDRMPPLQACPPNSRSLPANLFGLPNISCLPFRIFVSTIILLSIGLR